MHRQIGILEHLAEEEENDNREIMQIIISEQDPSNLSRIKTKSRYSI